MRQNLRCFVAGAAVVSDRLLAIAAGDLAVFKAGEPIKSAEVNANFGLLKAGLQPPERGARQTRLGRTACPADD